MGVAYWSTGCLRVEWWPFIVQFRCAVLQPWIGRELYC